MSPARVEPFRVAIIGGGIGGLFAALSLNYNCSENNIAVDVYEQARQYSHVGTGIVLGINASKLIHQIGLGPQLTNIGADLGAWKVSFRRYDNAGDILTVPMRFKKAVGSTPVLRSEFLDMMREAIKERNAGTIHTGKKCVKVEVRMSFNS